MSSPTIRQISHMLKEELQALDINIQYCFPYNHFDDDSVYWLTNGSSRPAYRHAKIFVHKLTDTKFLMGMHVEKGCNELNEDVQCRMKPVWDWHLFKQKWHGTERTHILTTLAKLNGTISISINNLPHRHLNHFEFTPSPFQYINPNENSPRRNPWLELGTLTEPDQLLSTIKKLDPNDNHWIDLSMQFTLDVDKDALMIPENVVKAIKDFAGWMNIA